MSKHALSIGNPQPTQKYSEISPLDLPKSKILVIGTRELNDISPQTSPDAMKRMWLEVLGFGHPATVLDSQEPTQLPFGGPTINPATVKAIAALPYSIYVDPSEGTTLKVDIRNLAPEIKEILNKLLATLDPAVYGLDFELPFGTKFLIGGGALLILIGGGVLLKRHMDAQP